jgi:alkanesulfonate monooxygenase SsuD/methylene tetrahydromethanopterin reductase-like flavin-dependent oxidoreductase (luciferase family)
MVAGSSTQEQRTYGDFLEHDERYARAEEFLSVCNSFWLGQPLFATDLSSCEDWELEVRLYQECRVVALPEVWSHVRWIDDGTRIGRACPGQPRSREQEIELLRSRLTVIDRSIQPGRLTADLTPALEDFRRHLALELARLEAAQA